MFLFLFDIPIAVVVSVADVDGVATARVPPNRWNAVIIIISKMNDILPGTTRISLHVHVELEREVPYRIYISDDIALGGRYPLVALELIESMATAFTLAFESDLGGGVGSVAVAT